MNTGCIERERNKTVNTKHARLVPLLYSAVSLVMLASFLIAEPLYAASTIQDSQSCSAINGSWNALNSTCTIASSLTVAAGDMLSVSQGVTLYFHNALPNSNWQITNRGTLINNGTILSEYTTVNGHAQGAVMLNNYGVLNNNGVIDVLFIRNYDTGSITNAQSLRTAWYLQNYGAFINATKATASLDLDTIQGGSVNNHGILSLGNVITNAQSHVSGMLTNHAGARIRVLSGHMLMLTTMIQNAGHVENAGRFYINAGGILDNTSGTFSNRINDGLGWMKISGDGVMTADKQGEYRNEGEMTINTNFAVQAGQVFRNSGRLGFWGSPSANQVSAEHKVFRNLGSIINTGMFEIMGGRFENSGDMHVSGSGGQLVHMNEAQMIVNSGTMTFADHAYARISRPLQNLQGARFEIDGASAHVSAFNAGYTGPSEFSNHGFVSITNLGQLVVKEPFVNYPKGGIYLGGPVRAGFFIVEDGGEFQNNGGMHAAACVIQREHANYAPSTITGSHPTQMCPDNVWSGLGGDNKWSTRQNWLKKNLGTPSGLPAPGESIEIRNNSLIENANSVQPYGEVHLDVPFELTGQGQLKIAEQATFIIDSVRELTVSDGAIENYGALTVGGGGSLVVGAQGKLTNYCLTDVYSSVPGVMNTGLIENFGRMTNHFTGDFVNHGGTLRNMPAPSNSEAYNRLCQFLKKSTARKHLANLGILRFVSGATFQNLNNFYNTWSSEGISLTLPAAFLQGEDWPRQRPVLKIESSTLVHGGGTFFNQGFIDGLCEACVDTRIENNGRMENHGILGIGGNPGAILSGREAEFVNNGAIWNEGRIYAGFYFPPEALIEGDKRDYQGYAKFLNARSGQIINGCLTPHTQTDPCGFGGADSQTNLTSSAPYIEFRLRATEFINAGLFENRSTGKLSYYNADGTALRDEDGTFQNFQPVFNQEPQPGTVECHVPTGELGNSADDFVGTYNQAFTGLVNISRACDPSLDTDGDGLSDVDEVNVHGTNPNKPDTDDDGISDFLEVEGRRTKNDAPEDFYKSNPLSLDSDNDTLGDKVERDGWHITSSIGNHWVNSSPNKVDTDGDGLTDLQEKNASTHPTFADIDQDGINDAAELQAGTDPFAANKPVENTMPVEEQSPSSGLLVPTVVLPLLY